MKNTKHEKKIQNYKCCLVFSLKWSNLKAHSNSDFLFFNDKQHLIQCRFIQRKNLGKEKILAINTNLHVHVFSTFLYFVMNNKMLR